MSTPTTGHDPTTRWGPLPEFHTIQGFRGVLYRQSEETIVKRWAYYSYGLSSGLNSGEIEVEVVVPWGIYQAILCGYATLHNGRDNNYRSSPATIIGEIRLTEKRIQRIAATPFEFVGQAPKCQFGYALDDLLNK